MHTHEQVTEHKSFARPEVVRNFPNGRAEILNVGGAEVGRLVFEPGWRWSNDVKPIARTASCEAPHFQYHVSDRLAIKMDDGTEFVAGPGDITSLPRGHDAWVVGNKPVVVVQRAPVYVRRSETLDLAVAAIAEAAATGAGLVIFPECFVPGYPAWIWRLRPGRERRLVDTDPAA